MKKYKTLEECFADQPEDKLSQINMLRRVILEAEPRLVETLKWNAPNYSQGSEDRITFNLMNKQGLVKLVLHMGATKKENNNGTPILQADEGIVEWSSDIRGTMTFQDASDVRRKISAVKQVVKGWLALSTK